MKSLELKKLADILNGSLHGDPNEPAAITGISTDSRNITAGDCFFAIKGENFDGHDHIKDALSKGAACAVVQDLPENPTTPIIKVDDCVTALGKLARWYRKELNFKCIAITGSAGKTTTRRMIHHVLSKKYNCLQSEKSFNNSIGLPMTILAAEDDHEIVIAELGSNAPGEISYLTDIAAPDIAVVTNIYPAHLEGFTSIEGIAKEKSSIKDALRADGKLIINGDFPDLVALCKDTSAECISFGTAANCDIQTQNIKTLGATGQLTIDSFEITVPTPGKANCLNALCAWSVCSTFGVTLEEFADSIKTLPQTSMRMQFETFGPVTVINDCYNANPASMENALDCLETTALSQKRRSVFICGTMAELGDQSENLHQSLGELISQKNISLLLTVGPFADTIANAAQKSGKNHPETHIFKNTELLCNKLQGFTQPDDIILVKGSRSMKLENAVEKLRELFSRAT
jgi:UDP-N-acetylmuramoyl-tripeptide--D-alanyl-D-alanine ligase